MILRLKLLGYFISRMMHTPTRTEKVFENRAKISNLKFNIYDIGKGVYVGTFS